MRLTTMMTSGTRVMVLGGYLKWRGGKLSGWEATIVDTIYDGTGYSVKFPWLKKLVYLPRELVCPVYHDCEVCGYGAWMNVNRGTEDHPDWHHFCAWHIPAPE